MPFKRNALQFWLITGLTAWCVLASGRSSFSAEIPNVHIHGSVDKTQFYTDEVIEYRLILKWKERYVDLRYRVPKLPLENLEWIDTTQTAETRLEENERVYERIIVYRLKPAKEGPAAVGQFVFEYGIPEAPDTSRYQIARTEFKIRKKPFLSRQAKKLAIGGSVALLFLIFAVNALISWIRKRQPSAEKISKNKLAYEDESILQLSGLEDLRSENRTREFVSKAGDIFRAYLRRKFDLGTSKFSSLEMLEVIERRRDVDSDDKKEIRRILQTLSESQFAGTDPRDEEAENIRRQIDAFIMKKKVVE